MELRTTPPPRSHFCDGSVCKTQPCGSIAEHAGVRDAWAIMALGV